ncbi:MAG: hypothetical protein ACLUHE_05380 [Christensenellales bacterium]
MKRLVTLWLLLALCLTAALALGETAQPCYWQLTDVSVTQKALDTLGPAAVSTNAEALSNLKPIDMIEALSQPHVPFPIDDLRRERLSNAHARITRSPACLALCARAGSAPVADLGDGEPGPALYVYASGLVPARRAFCACAAPARGCSVSPSRARQSPARRAP